ncbi:High-affinity nickel transport protein [Streptomyces sp. RB5]|uniref:Nickel/cobalt efflux system n=1 Tax=Streptomyces smaragdinus TaxID=2585196 RepID=A0A7K0CKI0_9ACTN|nr:HoxN/HupN/NixA family nickel/cobalt transporter [Streptomyces smaragdinus]MQY13502.1 High-affinity nickel transport protein [Streptomyces smaragdinus]
MAVAELTPRTYRSSVVLVLGILATTVCALLLLVDVTHTHHFAAGTFGTGLGITAYTLGARHAFDADHIAAIDNTTRTFMAEGRPSEHLGFWFALGHSSVVVVLSLLTALGARLATRLTDDSSSVHRLLSLLGTSVSGLFLILVGVLNLVAARRLLALYRAARRGEHDAGRLRTVLDERGLLSRVLRRVTAATTRPWHMFPLGLLFGLGFDTATEVTLLVLSGAGAASGVPWYALMLLPLLFACGMSLFDTLDGVLMTAAYRRAFADPVRQIFYGLTTTGLSAAAALVVGAITLVGLGVPRIGLDNAGYLVAGLFLAAWTCSVVYRKTAGSRRAGAGLVRLDPAGD